MSLMIGSRIGIAVTTGGKIGPMKLGLIFPKASAQGSPILRQSLT